MDRSFKGSNVDLFLLCEWIKRFFEKKEFRVAKYEQTRRYRIVARPTYVHEIVDSITVHILGDPSDFTVKFVTGGRSDIFRKFGLLTSLFGGGFAFLRGVKSQEAEEKLEKSFWVYVSEKIDFLANSAQTR